MGSRAGSLGTWDLRKRRSPCLAVFFSQDATRHCSDRASVRPPQQRHVGVGPGLEEGAVTETPTSVVLALSGSAALYQSTPTATVRRTVYRSLNRVFKPQTIPDSVWKTVIFVYFCFVYLVN